MFVGFILIGLAIFFINSGKNEFIEIDKQGIFISSGGMNSPALGKRKFYKWEEINDFDAFLILGRNGNGVHCGFTLIAPPTSCDGFYNLYGCDNYLEYNEYGGMKPFELANFLNSIKNKHISNSEENP
ncbi:MAG: hypothetical protein SFU25_02540 [Candidatus Caenarcaniphilales bacterium]|nr:hypothetical protein [Candidatus Caenarcaniphilales bacterium]